MPVPMSFLSLHEQPPLGAMYTTDDIEKQFPGISLPKQLVKPAPAALRGFSSPTKRSLKDLDSVLVKMLDHNMHGATKKKLASAKKRAERKADEENEEYDDEEANGGDDDW